MKIYEILCERPKYKDIMQLNDLIIEALVIKGIQDPQHKDYYTQVINFLITKLGIPDTNIILHVGLSGLFSSGHTGSTLPDPTRPNIIHMFIPKGLDRASLLRAICHEMVHVQQLATKRLELKIENGKLIEMKWEGKPISTAKYNRNGPWELEAHIKEKTLLHDVIQKVGNLMQNS